MLKITFQKFKWNVLLEVGNPRTLWIGYDTICNSIHIHRHQQESFLFDFRLKKKYGFVLISFLPLQFKKFLLIKVWIANDQQKNWKPDLHFHPKKDVNLRHHKENQKLKFAHNTHCVNCRRCMIIFLLQILSIS